MIFPRRFAFVVLCFLLVFYLFIAGDAVLRIPRLGCSETKIPYYNAELVSASFTITIPSLPFRFLRHDRQ